MLSLKKLSESELRDQLTASLSSTESSNKKSEVDYLSHELHTHQIELEMQNRELRESQLELEKSRDRYADLFDFAPVGYLSLDKKGVIHEVNLTGASMLGTERGRIIGMPFGRFLKHEDEIKLFNHLNQVFQSSTNVVDEIKLGVKEGLIVTAQIESVFSGIQPNQDGLCRTILTDISERKCRENELLKAKQIAEEADQAKSKFLSRMSHELRTPLNAILGFSQIIDISNDDTLLAEHRESLNAITQSGWHLLRIIDDLLDLAAIEAGKAKLSFENVNVHETIQSCIEIITPLARQHHVALNLTEDECLNMQMWADPSGLKQVLLNLLSNAVKYNKKQGSVSVNYTSTPEGNVRVEVTDTGSGIREENISSLFQPFSRLHDRDFSIQGAGIELSITKGIIELMNGAIGVESVFEQGSTFWFEIPQAPDSDKEK